MKKGNDSLIGKIRVIYANKYTVQIELDNKGIDYLIEVLLKLKETPGVDQIELDSSTVHSLGFMTKDSLNLILDNRDKYYNQIGMDTEQFIDRFISAFTLLSDKDKEKFMKKIEKGRFMWDIFEGNLSKPYLVGEDARKAFDAADKKNAIDVCFDNGFMGYPYEANSLQNDVTSKRLDVDRLPERYIIGEDFSWCYVITHEFDLCGPYFCKN